MLYAAGVPNEETMQDAPHIGIASVWWEGNPCNMHLLELAKTVKENVKKQGFLAWQYNTIGVSDGITMGSEGAVLLLLLSPLAHFFFLRFLIPKIL